MKTLKYLTLLIAVLQIQIQPNCAKTINEIKRQINRRTNTNHNNYYYHSNNYKNNNNHYSNNNSSSQNRHEFTLQQQPKNVNVNLNNVNNINKGYPSSQPILNISTTLTAGEVNVRKQAEGKKSEKKKPKQSLQFKCSTSCGNGKWNCKHDCNIFSAHVKWPITNLFLYSSTGSRKRRSVFHVRWNPNERFIVESNESPAINSSKLAPHPRLKVSKTTKLNLNAKHYLCHDKLSPICANKTLAFKERILKTFEKSLLESVNESNYYNVDFKPVFGESFEEQYYPSTCLVMEAGVKVLRRKDPPFNKLQFGKLFPKQKLFRQKKNIKTCAIVSSAGSMAGSKLGRFIGE